MSTNFYWITTNERRATLTLPSGEEIEGPAIGEDDPRVHIGLRSAAGRYCWDCRVTLCKNGEEGVHRHTTEFDWYDRCPRCKQAPAREEGFPGPAAIELGFAESGSPRPTGVRGTCSFSWAQDPGGVLRTCEARMDDEIVVDEYGHRLTGGAFLAMLRANCGINILLWIGQEFS